MGCNDRWNKNICTVLSFVSISAVFYVAYYGWHGPEADGITVWRMMQKSKNDWYNVSRLTVLFCNLLENCTYVTTRKRCFRGAVV